MPMVKDGALVKDLFAVVRVKRIGAVKIAFNVGITGTVFDLFLKLVYFSIL